MATLTDYTSYAEVRAVLGVSEAEINNAALSLPMYVAFIEDSFDSVSTEVLVQYDRIAAINPITDRTRSEQRFYDTARLVAAYAVGRALALSLDMFAVKRLDDGKASFERFDNNLEELRDSLDQMYINLVYRLGLLLQDLVPGTIVPDYGAVTTTTVVVGVSPDPVTGA